MKATGISQVALMTLLVTAGVGCMVGEAPRDKRAVANMESRSGSTVTGDATFTGANGAVTLKLNVIGATPGTHAVHLHQVPDCSSPDANSAMGHWNPDMMNHGLPNAAAHHLGDCGNFEVGADGKGTLTITNAWSIGTGAVDDVIGHALIFHASPDDGMTQMPP